MRFGSGATARRLIVPIGPGLAHDVVLLRLPTGREASIIVGEHDARLPDAKVIRDGAALFVAQTRDHAGEVAATLVEWGLSRTSVASVVARAASLIAVGFILGCSAMRAIPSTASAPVPVEAQREVEDWSIEEMREWAMSPRTALDEDFCLILDHLAARRDPAAICKAVLYGSSGIAIGGREHPRCIAAKRYLEHFTQEEVVSFVGANSARHGHEAAHLAASYLEIVSP